MITGDYTSINKILQGVTMNVGDQEMRKLAKGFYISFVRDALRELAFDSFFDERTNIFVLPSESLVMVVPSGMFNIREMWAFSCSHDNTATEGEEVSDCGCCTPASAAKIWYKSKGNNLPGGGKNFTSPRKSVLQQDAMNPLTSPTTSVLWYGMEGSRVMFGSACSSYNRVKIKYNGIGPTDADDLPIVPSFFEKAIEGRATEFACQKLLAVNPQLFGGLLKYWAAEVHRDYDGLWITAMKRKNKLDTGALNDYKEYLGRLNY